MQLIFDNFLLAREPFTKDLWSLESCILVNYNSCGKLVSSLESPIKFDESFKVTLVLLFIPDFNLLRSELDNFTYKMLYWVILY